MSKENNYKSELAKKLLKLNDEDFILAKRIFIDSKIKFIKRPILEIETLNINIIEALNTEQLRFLFSLINQELAKRGMI